MTEGTFETGTEYEEILSQVLARAIKWQLFGRRADFLLRGADLEQLVKWFTSPTNLQPKPTHLQYQYVLASLSEQQYGPKEAQNKQDELQRQLNEIVSSVVTRLIGSAHAIKSCSALISHDVECGWEGIRESLDILDSVAGQLVREIQGLSQMLGYGGSNNLELRDTDIVNLVQQKVQALEPLIEEKGLAISIQNYLEQPVAKVDSHMLGMAIAHIIENAIDFNSDNGRIDIKLENAEDGTLIISIADTGIAIAPERLQGKTIPHYGIRFEHGWFQGGKGFGLKVATRMVALHGGEIGVKSKAGVGSEFIIRIPTKAAAP